MISTDLTLLLLTLTKILSPLILILTVLLPALMMKNLLLLERR